MADYGMGFQSCEAPKSASARLADVIGEFIGSEDEAIKIAFDDVQKAKAMQSNVSKTIRTQFPDSGLKCRRNDATVYVIKEA